LDAVGAAAPAADGPGLLLFDNRGELVEANAIGADLLDRFPDDHAPSSQCRTPSWPWPPAPAAPRQRATRGRPGPARGPSTAAGSCSTPPCSAAAPNLAPPSSSSRLARPSWPS
jgi:hypothetical protein